MSNNKIIEYTPTMDTFKSKTQLQLQNQINQYKTTFTLISNQILSIHSYFINDRSLTIGHI